MLLENFEAGNEVVAETQKIVEPPLQMSLFTEEEPIAPAGAEAGAEVLKKLEKVNILGTSPMQAMNILYELQQELLNMKK